MSRFARLTLLLVLVAACARPTRVVMQPDEYEPLNVSILPPTSGFGFWVNQPAYVAMFDVQPGIGVGLLYPQVSSQLTRMVRSGSAFAHSTFTLGPRAYFAGRVLNRVHFIVAVASRKPLSIDRIVGFSDWMTYKLGVAAYAGPSLEMMNGLFEEVVPVQPDDDWATAVYVVYSGVPWRQNVYRYVRCPDGNVYVVNVEALRFACPAPKAPDNGTSPENDDQGRRPAHPETARTGSAIARLTGGADLPILSAMTDVVLRPPEPATYRTYAPGASSGRSGSGSATESAYAPRPESSSQPSSQPSVTRSESPAPVPQAHVDNGGSTPQSRGATSNSRDP
ncbi:MAG: hypothetical protein EXR93_03100 [Gemmatimonadetes bacterium]|nr:hypothetical protein [Gemmatimonadota bacterium]